ncbi:hypothetical protein EAI_11399 [Harpegnathos saltator]|uniref:Uncharacterized protein n=1 Tax=Harpegnathos saltator TaxID=610380 RepID=E2BAC0_HARSA|nr:hypothetical protein EAI_11399 [Harpegnathos saltator]
MFLQWMRAYITQMLQSNTIYYFSWVLYRAAGDPNAWRLGRIEETDHETPV